MNNAFDQVRAIVDARILEFKKRREERCMLMPPPPSEVCCEMSLEAPRKMSDLAEAEEIARNRRIEVEKLSGTHFRRMAARLPVSHASVTDAEIESLRILLAELNDLWSARMGEPNVTWKIRKVKSVWGCCHWRSRYITYNAELAHAPRELVEYVGVHEDVRRADRSVGAAAPSCRAFPLMGLRRMLSASRRGLNLVLLLLASGLVAFSAQCDRTGVEIEPRYGNVAEGRHYDYVGRAFERDVAAVLSNAAYLEASRSGRDLGDPKYAHFKRLVTAFGIDARRIAGISATADRREIGELPGGGAPKTDVLVTVTLSDGKEILKTVSCKRVTGTVVTAHQYGADEFARVLDPHDEALRQHLRSFQKAGNFRDMPQGAAETLERLLAPHVEKLCRWAVSGTGGGGTDRQIAGYVVTYRPKDNSFAVHSADEYVRWLLTKCPRKKGGTPFNWTYQGVRGTNIQLKMPVMP